MSSELTSRVSSPCIDVCKLNNNNICTGCYRTIDEITQWRSLNRNKQIEIIEVAKQRKQLLNE